MAQLVDRLRQEIAGKAHQEFTLSQKRHCWSYYCGYISCGCELGALTHGDWEELHTLLTTTLKTPTNWGR